jgi:Amt family ammonium transporter
LITGATADRLKFSAYAVFIGVWSVLVYAPVAHWVFSPQGWLFRRGALDFAGGAVVHINAGVAALVLVLVLGRRRGWPGEPMPPHNLPFTLLGTGILWFGWFGFNAGSALGANQTAAVVFTTTLLAGAAGSLGWLALERVRDGHATSLGAASGLVSGLVAITPSCGSLSPIGSIVMGLVAGVVCALAVGMKYRFGYDDSLDVVGVHFIGGVLGMLFLGLAASNAVNPGVTHEGLLYGGGLWLLGRQALAVLAATSFAFAASWLVASAVNLVMPLRVSEEDEHLGLDQALHAESAYDLGSVRTMGRIS